MWFRTSRRELSDFPCQGTPKTESGAAGFCAASHLCGRGWIANNATRQKPEAIGHNTPNQSIPDPEAIGHNTPDQNIPSVRYSQSDALDLVAQEIGQGHIRVTVFGRQNGLHITDMEGRTSGGESTGIPNGAHCPPNTWGITFTGISGYSDVFPLAPVPQSRGVPLAYCVNKYSGAIKAGNDYAREFTTVPDSAAIFLKPHDAMPVTAPDPDASQKH